MMISTVALVFSAALGAADLHAASDAIGSLPPLHTGVAPAVPGAIPGRIALNDPILDEAWRTRPLRAATLLAQAPASSPTPTPAASGAPASTAPASDASSSAAPADDSSGGASEEEPDIELLRHRARITRIHRPLGIAAWSSLLITEIIGTIQMINLPTIFGDGMCSSNPPPGAPPDWTGCIGGTYASSLDQFHQVSAFITLGFYGAAGIFALSMPDPEHATVGNDTRANRLRLHKRLALVHAVGMILQPLLGVIAYDPGLIGIHDNLHSDIQRDLRTIHAGIGYVTFAALTSAMIIELMH